MAAKKRKSTKRRTRRAVGAFKFGGRGKNKMIDTLQLAAGTIMGGMGARMLDNSIPEGFDPKIVSLAKIAAGYAITAASNNDIVRGVGVGIIANGGSELATSFGIMAGTDVNYAAPATPAASMICPPSRMNSFNYVAGGINGVGIRTTGSNLVSGVGKTFYGNMPK